MARLSRGRGVSDQDKAKMSMHDFSGEGAGDCEKCGLPKRNTVHNNPDRQHPPGEGYSYQQAQEKRDNQDNHDTRGKDNVQP